LGNRESFLGSFSRDGFFPFFGFEEQAILFLSSHSHCPSSFIPPAVIVAPHSGVAGVTDAEHLCRQSSLTSTTINPNLFVKSSFILDVFADPSKNQPVLHCHRILVVAGVAASSLIHNR
jgi:hypothetical protein